MPAAATKDAPAPAPAADPATPPAADAAPATPAAPDPNNPPKIQDTGKGTGVFLVNGRWVNAHGEPVG